MIRIVLALGAAALLGTHAAMALPTCAGPVEGKSVKIIRVEKNGDLIDQDGRAVRLEGIRLPSGSVDHAPEFLAGQARDALNDLAVGRTVTLSAFVPKEDRYGRLRAQVFFPQAADDQWLQKAMLERGLAQVDIAPNRRECASELYAAEAKARKKRYGIWMSSAYAVRAAHALEGTTGTFQIVEGKVVSADIHDGRAFLDFGRDRHKDFKITISPEDVARFRDAGVDPRSYEGLTLRVRGYVDWLGGPEIEASSPESIEVVQSH